MWGRSSPDKIDKYIADASDQTARRISRREGLSKMLRGTAAVLAGVAAGQIVSPSAAAAQSCSCVPPRGVYCSGCPSGPEQRGCPSGYAVCTTSSGCSPCIYASGYWTACTGQGSGGHGYRVCYDCWRNSSCGTTCGCLSGVLCGGCRTPADVRAVMASVEQEAQLSARSAQT
ncbi:hypothetical protein [Allonocardiopsis opalescens]|uniref:Uncharacterized protein n=1 Tax=Allonocardiopsis opalescens TaxID=1144618 RepID=A0A2T0Q2P1_9ACTN|nr:hypothetical protein [Allonocardiopsis opalescens]PRX98063.1 hypothetical protein CLV72_105416 [Allonocardiopsis opalescens]